VQTGAVQTDRPTRLRRPGPGGRPGPGLRHLRRPRPSTIEPARARRRGTVAPHADAAIGIEM